LEPVRNAAAGEGTVTVVERTRRRTDRDQHVVGFVFESLAESGNRPTGAHLGLEGMGGGKKNNGGGDPAGEALQCHGSVRLLVVQRYRLVTPKPGPFSDWGPWA